MMQCQVLKAADNGIVYGWAAISRQSGADFFDSDNQHIPGELLEGAAVEFADGDRVMSLQHDGAAFGKVLFMFPMIGDIPNALGLTAANGREGLIVGVRPDNQEVVQAVRDGTLTGFSIGGTGSFQDVQKMRFDGKTTAQKAALLKLLEISLVDVPAMTGCDVAIVKAADVPVRDLLMKQAASADQLLEQLVDQHQRDTGCSATEAWRAVSRTPAGGQLYAMADRCRQLAAEQPIR